MMAAMVEYKRSERVGDQIRMEIADILMTKVKDPRVGFVTVTSVEVSEDLRNAKVFISVLGPDAARSFQGLEKARSFIRSELGRRLKLRFVPELSFHEDHTAEEAAKIFKLMEKVKESPS
ncbi:MAG TPA: 30S ribosome-binding factor RbfA [Nitrospiria bacterium]|nr:30S ribosome-binding factor RbfA [Nitrospiria bacterium]